MEKSPVIIIGMHRSGTSLLTKLLEKLGMYTGQYKEGNDEALFFLRINEWIYKEANASWDNPHNMNFLDDYVDNYIMGIVKKRLHTYQRIEYLGIHKYFKYKSIGDIDIVWGWKDPRNTFTIDIWKKIFPNAKIIHIYRNPIDVAESLRSREEKQRQAYKLGWRAKLSLKRLRAKISFTNSVRISNIHEGINLWSEYVERALESEQKYKNDIMSIQYEDFLSTPGQYMQEITKFINLQVADELINEACKEINPERKYAFLKDPKLVAIYGTISKGKLLKKLGYDNIMNKEM